MRLDHAVVARSLVPSRTKAIDAIKEGRVTVDGVCITKPAHWVEDHADVCLSDADPWVSRAAHKLLHAFEAWPDLQHYCQGHTCLDVGASTGGFTQVLLHHGATSVIALDVGRDQLHPHLHADPRVIDLSETSIRGATPRELGGPFTCVVTDLSFISLTVVMDQLAALIQEDGVLVALVKPQFEVGKQHLGKNGVVAAKHLHLAALQSVADAASRVGLTFVDGRISPLAGRHGNREYVTLWSRTDPASDGQARLERMLHELVSVDETQETS